MAWWSVPSTLLVLSLWVWDIRAAIGPVTDLHIVNAQISPDGFTRSAVLAEGVFPGPVIKANKGDNLKINVVDQLTDSSMQTSTSIHWHGVFQHGGTNWADGPAFITQCPIKPGNSFLYDFHVPDQAGTYWYHSHLSVQYCDGLRGPLIIYDPADPHKDLYDVDDDSTVITLSDWYHTPTLKLGSVKFPESDSTLINGRGRSSSTLTSPLTVITVTPGKRYRFRLISMSCDPQYAFSISGHTMTIIEADGINVEPLVVDSLTIFASQRYSFVLTANATVGNYWIRAIPNHAVTLGTDGGTNSAILRYDGAAAVDPPAGEQTNPTSPLNEASLRPLSTIVNAGVPGTHTLGAADISLNLALDFSASDNKFTINGKSFVSPTVPVLLQILSGQQDARDLMPQGMVYPLETGKVVELSIPAGVTMGPHPFHLHGHTFDVIRSAGSTVYNYDNPIRRDTVSIGDTGDNVTVRFRTDNSGPWMFHCHVDWHLEAGMAIIFAEDIPGASRNPVPQAWKDLCSNTTTSAPGPGPTKMTGGAIRLKTTMFVRMAFGIMFIFSTLVILLAVQAVNIIL